jgi:asparagine synthase (glutamine-hydrolysing)
MCGICGVVALDPRETVAEDILERMCETLVHRGPDSRGSWFSGPAGLGVRRLAVIDVAGADQPLADEDNQIRAVCNGEIYNYRELRSELLRQGHRFRTEGDCEVIVHAYEEYGDTFVTHLNGMFAIGLWDARRKRLLLARDRVGIKPLYYAQHNGCLLFSSELKAVLAYPGFPRRLDSRALTEFLTYEYVPTPRSIFVGIAKLRPGHILILEHGRARQHQYWSLDLKPDPWLRATPVAELADELWLKIRESVRMELVSDVPLGIFLSGGIDSSAVAAAAAEVSPAPRTFSIAFEDESFDESRYARKVSAYLGTHHEEQVFRPSALQDLVPDALEGVDEPLADPSFLATYLLSQFARRQVTVALAGDGGDELFAGYSTLQAHKLAGYYRRVPSFVRDRLITRFVERMPVSYDNLSLGFRAKRFVTGTRYPPAERHHAWLGAFEPAEQQRLLAGACDSKAFEALDEHTARSATYDALSQILYLDMKMYLEGDILPKVDRASMACSLEVRVPLLNPILLDFGPRLPIDLKLRGFTRKYLLRQALAGKLPEEIVRRSKKGFGIPLARWLRTELRPLMLDTLSYQSLRSQGIFNADYVESLVTTHLRGQRDNRKLLWPLIVFQLWHSRYLHPH